MRDALLQGSVITMPNGGRFIIQEKIAEGGLSLLYSALTDGNGYEVVVKEFFPERGAERNGNGQVVPSMNAERFRRSYAAFENEGKLGQEVRNQSFQTLSFADCGNGYAIMPRWARNTRTLQSVVTEWQKNPPPPIDPVFTFSGRVKASLCILRSLLEGLQPIHELGIIHLDLSATNACLSGDWHKGAVFISDFGCAQRMGEDGTVGIESALSVSKDYAGKEYFTPGGRLGRFTDLYAAGCVFRHLLFGDKAFGYGYTSTATDLLYGKRLPPRAQAALKDMLEKACADKPEERYQSCEEMLSALENLNALIPERPVNPDVSLEFNLYYLRAMIEGGRWAEELRDRRGVEVEIPARDPKKISRKFNSEEEFLQAVLPRQYRRWIEGIPFHELFSLNYEKEKKAAIVAQIRSESIPDDRLSTKAEGLRNDIRDNDIELVIELLVEPGSIYTRNQLDACIRRIPFGCSAEEQERRKIGFLILLALLGKEHFSRLIGNNPEAAQGFVSQ